MKSLLSLRYSIIVSGSMLIFLGAISCSSADAPPINNQNYYCRVMVSNYPGNYSSYENCIDKQQEAYDRLKSKWDSLPPEWRHGCSNRQGYDELEKCFDGQRSVYLQGQQKEKQMPEKAFRY